MEVNSKDLFKQYLIPSIREMQSIANKPMQDHYVDYLEARSRICIIFWMLYNSGEVTKDEKDELVLWMFRYCQKPYPKVLIRLLKNAE
jgi:hypothetical protein